MNQCVSCPLKHPIITHSRSQIYAHCTSWAGPSGEGPLINSIKSDLPGGTTVPTPGGILQWEDERDAHSALTHARPSTVGPQGDSLSLVTRSYRALLLQGNHIVAEGPE